MRNLTLVLATIVFNLLLTSTIGATGVDEHVITITITDENGNNLSEETQNANLEGNPGIMDTLPVGAVHTTPISADNVVSSTKWSVERKGEGEKVFFLYEPQVKGLIFSSAQYTLHAENPKIDTKVIFLGHINTPLGSAMMFQPFNSK